MRPALLLALLLPLVPACGPEGMPDSGGADTRADARAEAGPLDAPPLDTAALDAETDAAAELDAADADPLDGGPSSDVPFDVLGVVDVGIDAPIDVGFDAGFDGGFDGGFDPGFDAGFDAGRDAGFDAGLDAGRDGGRDTPPGAGCVSGATGTHVARFRWNGSGSGSTAWVSYEANTLPDTSRWRASAASMSIGYTPVYTDTFLAEGGLDLSGTVFIDVELSTVGLGTLRNVTIALYGRSFATTTSGSFRWQTFDGTGATPHGSMANSAPYEWYLGDATAAFSPGDDGVLLRLRAGPPSSSLVVSRVEICFDAS